MQEYATRARLPGYQYGQYREQSLLDPSVFNFYENLIDGRTSREGEDRDAYNIALSQTGWDNRVGAGALRLPGLQALEQLVPRLGADDRHRHPATLPGPEHEPDKKAMFRALAKYLHPLQRNVRDR